MATTEAPVSMAEAFPRETEWRTVTAPAARAWSWVPSVRAVVDDDDEVHSRDGAAGPDSGGDALSLILGRNDHGNALVGPLGGTHSPRVSRLPASSRYLSASLSRAFFVRPVKFCDLMPCGAESSGSEHSAGTPADPRARRVGLCDTPVCREADDHRPTQAFLGDLVSNLQHGTTVPEKLGNLAAMNQVPSFGS